jgi:hypothetical protein
MARTLLLIKSSLLFALLVCTQTGQAQDIPVGVRVVSASPTLGPLIDAQEKATFGLFPYYSASDFEQARFTRALAPDSAVVLYTLLRDGRTVTRPFSEADFRSIDQAVSARVNELYGGRNHSGKASSPASNQPETVGQVYFVDVFSGASFTGTLTAATPEALEFDVKELGQLRILRANIRQLLPLTAEQARRNWAPVGNGTRVFFSPTARNLRQGEGYVQSINIFFLGANYGLTDNISVGVLALLPIGGFDNSLLAITPKFSAPVSENLNLGAGALVSRAFDTTFGVGYGVGTYGTADQNLTLGLGYAFAEGEISSTPVVVIGGAKRVSRRFSLLNETYLAGGGALGLFGLRFAGPQTSGSLGFAYGSGIPGIFPAYAEIAYRFGRVK